jgi:ferrous iron transport protein A
MTISLNHICPGEKVRIVGFRAGEKSYRHMLMAMGLIPNTVIEFVRSAPLGDPVQIRVRNSSVSLRKNEAVLLILERV